jgi:hypothetical protein
MSINAITSGTKKLCYDFAKVMNDHHGCERTFRFGAQLISVSGTKVKAWLNLASGMKGVAKVTELTMAFELWKITWDKGTGYKNYRDFSSHMSYTIYRTSTLFNYLTSLGFNKIDTVQFFAKTLNQIGNLPIISQGLTLSNTVYGMACNIPVLRVAVLNPISAFSVWGMSCRIYDEIDVRKKALEERHLYNAMKASWVEVKSNLESVNPPVHEIDPSRFRAFRTLKENIRNLERKPSLSDKDQNKLAIAQNAVQAIENANSVFAAFASRANNVPVEDLINLADREINKWNHLSKMAQHEYGKSAWLTCTLVFKVAQNSLYLLTFAFASLATVSFMPALMTILGFTSAAVGFFEIWHNITTKAEPVRENVVQNERDDRLLFPMPPGGPNEAGGAQAPEANNGLRQRAVGVEPVVPSASLATMTVVAASAI